MTYKKLSFSSEPNVSRETLECFETWHNLLLKWNARINLVSQGAMGDFWERHALDSWQLMRFVVEHRKNIEPNGNYQCLDLGSGAGFPGLALAIGMKSQESVKQVSSVKLVESAGKKANFLRSVIRELALPATVWSGRAEDLMPETYDLISARAFAPLPRLFAYANPFWGQWTLGLFLKGRGFEKELTEARKYWTFDVESIASRSDPDGVVLKITNLAART